MRYRDKKVVGCLCAFFRAASPIQLMLMKENTNIKDAQPKLSTSIIISFFNLLFCLNAIYYKWRGVNFSPGRIEFFCGPKNSQRFALGMQQIFFLVLKKGKTFS
jgi:hypothetical protein